MDAEKKMTIQEAADKGLLSQDVAEEKREQLKQLFPEVFTENKVDFEQLHRVLGDWIEPGKERYGLNWPGKTDCMKVIQAPSIATLKPARDESVDFDDTEHLFIEGDNLEVLKLLQKAYFGKIKMIYIDPPYNTGKEFIYPDKYQETLDTYLAYSGQVDDAGREFSTDTDKTGRFHSFWLNMMYSRLYLARNLLRDDGLIFISIGDDEQANLKSLCNLVFGEENFCAQLIWNTEGNTDNQYKIKVNHEYILVYYKDIEYADQAVGRVIDPNTPEDSNLRKGYADNNINKNNPENPPSIIELPAGFPCSEEELLYDAKDVDDRFFEIANREKFISDELKQEYGIENISGLPVKLDDMVVKNHQLASPCRIFVGMANKNKLLEFIDNDCKPIIEDGMPMKFYINANAAVRYRKENENPRNILSVLRGLGTTETSKTSLRRLGIYYDYPKPVDLMKYLLEIGCHGDGDIVLDFFAGSGTTAQALYEMESEDQKNRRYILVQLPEKIDPSKKEQKAAFDFCERAGKPHVISEISKERLRIIGKNIADQRAGQLALGQVTNSDLGFRVFKLSSSNFRIWDGDADQLDDLEEQLKLHVDHIDQASGPEDILYELLLKSGFKLTTKVEKRTMASKDVYAVADGALLICLDKEITPELIDALADADPLQVICLDEGFKGNDQLKTNAVQTFKSRAKEDEEAIVFRTV
ncbi:site-specific DNA-methyltransferase [Hyphomonas sp. UBA3201]|uniref:site-specific DNA-methyltransferase n=1 Tax=Hyphomonas sp. UBA3201 TaxID=1946623 RepID=UPI0025C14BCB|nr:site-specific DNA-methyltransferase [Hyphomonas sp. UBA3201]